MSELLLLVCEWCFLLLLLWISGLRFSSGSIDICRMEGFCVNWSD